MVVVDVEVVVEAWVGMEIVVEVVEVAIEVVGVEVVIEVVEVVEFGLAGAGACGVQTHHA